MCKPIFMTHMLSQATPLDRWDSVWPMAQDDVGERFIAALTQLDELSSGLTVDEALSELDEATLQVFWRDWPNINSWAAAIWRRLNDDLARPASPPASDLDEVGGSG
jgi:hypothetical protein